LTQLALSPTIDDVSRKLVALALSLAVQTAALIGPFVHAHVSAVPTSHHGQPNVVHAHLNGHQHAALPAGSRELGADEDERPIWLQLFVATAPSADSLPGIVNSSYEMPLPNERPLARTTLVVRSHDPPTVRSLPPRAPPSLSA
jgi:hypothetical protein